MSLFATCWGMNSPAIKNTCPADTPHHETDHLQKEMLSAERVYFITGEFIPRHLFMIFVLLSFGLASSVQGQNATGGVPLGGIGTGTIRLHPDGSFGSLRSPIIVPFLCVNCPAVSPPFGRKTQAAHRRQFSILPIAINCLSLLLSIMRACFLKPNSPIALPPLFHFR